MNEYIKPLTESTMTDFHSLFENEDEWERYQCTCFIREDIDWETVNMEESKNWRKNYVNSCSDGYLYYSNNQPIGWCQCVEPRCSNILSSMIKPEETEDVKLISCFFIKKGHRQKGVIKSILKLILLQCQSDGIKTLYSIPMLDEKLKEPGVIPHTGFRKIFDLHNFSEVGKTENSFIMKKVLSE